MHVLRPALLVALAGGAFGCAAPLDDPGRFLDGGTSGTASCAGDVETDIFAARCGGSVCHSAEEQRAAGLDLVTPGVAERVANVASASAECGGSMLVVPGDPGASLLYQKLGDSPPCGSRMPLAQEPLSDEDTECVQSWIQEMAL
ncbi:MAG TPA: hypothetical protein VFU21_30630 [Kofleriaceae bacterium]|nr:hypothetical protein [Kofleriaceae bacterium]